MRDAPMNIQITGSQSAGDVLDVRSRSSQKRPPIRTAKATVATRGGMDGRAGAYC